MARLDDEQGRPLGGLEYPHSRLGPTLEAMAASHRAPHRTRLAPKFGPEETVPGLVCSYGALAYTYDDRLRRKPLRRCACHSPVEDTANTSSFRDDALTPPGLV